MRVSMKAILIDDEKLALDFLEHQTKQFTDLKVMAKFRNPWEAAKYIDGNRVDIVFLDIHLPEINGIELAEKLVEKNPGIHIVFVTGHDEYAIQAFEINALDYVLKPVSVERLANTLDRIREKIPAHNKKNVRKSQLKIELFQRFAIISQDNKLINPNWRTTKVEQLFFYLLHRRDQVVEKTELIELLWPDLDYKRAFSQLYTSIYHIRKSIEQYDHHIQLSNTSIGYMLTLEDVALDIEQFEEIVRKDEVISQDNITDFEYAISLYKGDYLQGYDYFWIGSERQRLEQLWLRTASKMLDWYFKQEKFDQVIGLAIEVKQRFPFEEEAYFYLMKAHAKRNQTSNVEQIFHELTEVLMHELQEKPMPLILKWYEKWKQVNEQSVLY